MEIRNTVVPNLDRLLLSIEVKTTKMKKYFNAQAATWEESIYEGRLKLVALTKVSLSRNQSDG